MQELLVATTNAGWPHSRHIWQISLHSVYASSYNGSWLEPLGQFLPLLLVAWSAERHWHSVHVTAWLIYTRNTVVACTYMAIVLLCYKVVIKGIGVGWMAYICGCVSHRWLHWCLQPAETAVEKRTAACLLATNHKGTSPAGWRRPAD